jgi:hypothetical protein
VDLQGRVDRDKVDQDRAVVVGKDQGRVDQAGRAVLDRHSYGCSRDISLFG